MRLKPTQAKFAAEYVKRGNATEAYRRAYPKAQRKNCAKNAASRALGYPQVQREIQRLQMKIARKTEITIEKILNDYQDGIEMAAAKNDAANVIAGATAQAKLCGLLVERREVGNVGDFDKMDNINEILEELTKQAGPDVARAMAEAFGYVQPKAEPTQQTVEEAKALLESKPGSDAVN